MAVIKLPRIIKTKRGSYLLHFYSPDGRRRRLSAGHDYTIAQRLAVKFTDWLLEGKDPEREMIRARKTEQARSITLKEFFPIFMERHGKLQSKNMQEFYGYRFKIFCRHPSLSTKPLRDINKALVVEYMHSRMSRDQVSAATVNREASLLRCMLNRAVDWETLDRNPLQNLHLLKESGKREVHLTIEQAKSLLQALPKPMADIAEFAIYTGFRKENILSLNIGQLRFYDLKPGGEVDLVVKGGKKETFPLSPKAVEVARRAIGARKDGYVFLNPATKTRYYSIHRTFDRAARKLGLKVGDTKLRFHDLRHAFASWLNQEGVPLDVLRYLLGHKDRATTDRYVSLSRLSMGASLDVIPELRGKKRASGK